MTNYYVLTMCQALLFISLILVFIAQIQAYNVH